jgi:chaperonin cofactor prefoldin
VQELEKRLEAVDTALEESHDRVAIMDEHLKNVQQELAYTQSRVRGLEG